MQNDLIDFCMEQIERQQPNMEDGVRFLLRNALYYADPIEKDGYPLSDKDPQAVLDKLYEAAWE